MEFTEAVFQQLVGKYRIRVEYRNYWSPPMACWAQAFNSYFCEASDVYMDECYDYPWRPLIHSTERQARRERSEKIKQEVKERLRKQGLIK